MERERERERERVLVVKLWHHELIPPGINDSKLRNGMLLYQLRNGMLLYPGHGVSCDSNLATFVYLFKIEFLYTNLQTVSQIRILLTKNFQLNLNDLLFYSNRILI